MGAAATFYLDNPSFEKATTVFADAALTTCAANGFYQIGGIVREQVDCTAGLGGRLLPAEPCPTCGSPATTAPPLTTPPPATTPPATQPPPDPLYYSLISCPTTSSGGGGTQKYTYIAPSTSSLNQRYQDSTQDPAIFYTYDNSAGITTPPPNSIDNNIQIVPGVFGCPTLDPVYNYYNAVECNNVSSIVVRSAESTTFVAGQVVKVTGSSLCYSITTVAAETTVYQDYDTSISPYVNCDACDPPAVDPNGFKVTQSGQPDNEVLQDVNNPRTEGEKVLTSINSNCWTLAAPVVTSTGYTITGDCPTVPTCTLFTFIGGSSGGTLTYTSCDGTNVNNEPIAANEEGARCVQTGTMVASGVTLDEQSPCGATPPTDPYDYYNLQKCDGTGSTIVARFNGATINNGQSVKISSVCYQVISTSTDNSTTTDIVATEIYTNCSACDPCAGVYTLSLTYNANNNCTTGSSQKFRTNNTTLLASTVIYQPTGACASTNYAPVGWYTQITASGSVSKFWDGFAFSQTINPCPTAPTTVTATLTEVDNQIIGPTAGYTIGGDKANDIITAPFGGSTTFTFNTTVAVNNGYTFSPGPTVNNFNGTLTNSDLTGVTTITGTVTQNTPTYFYQIQECNTNTLFNLEAGVSYNNGTLVAFYLKGAGGAGNVRCGTIIGNAQSAATVEGTIMYPVPTQQCSDFQCPSTLV